MKKLEMNSMDSKEECPKLFSRIVQPPPNIKTVWRGMIPEWAWNAMVDDTVKVLKTELPRKTEIEDIERRIRNRHVFIKKEAFFPEAFLPDVVKDACQIKSKTINKKILSSHNNEF